MRPYFKASSRRPRRLLAVFAVVTLLPAIGLVWLGKTLIAQDHELAEKQLRDRLESEIDWLASTIARELTVPAPVTASGSRGSETATVPPQSMWEAAEAAEHQDRQEFAIAHYTGLAKSSDPSVRAGALIRLARVFRRVGRSEDALLVYDGMKGMDDVEVFDAPASLQAALARVREFAARGNEDARDREAAALRTDLARGRWRIDRPTLENAWSQVASPVVLAGSWRRLSDDRRLAVVLTDAAGQSVFESGALAGPTVVRTPSESPLPWTIRVSSASPQAELAAFGERRQQLLLVMSLAVFLVLAGAYFVARGVRRELAVAQLQSSFVSAVSHEFRTPLTSMSHLIELLRDRPDIAPVRRVQYYDALEQEARRLRRFVDQLLDFGRIEAGAASYRLEPMDLRVLVEDVVARFRSGPVASGHPVEVLASPALPLTDGDSEALSGVLDNLLENAAKYSPQGGTIAVDVRHDSGRVLVDVRDSGAGIPSDEHEIIFDKFVRGRQARASGVGGTGVGLALAREIVRAHGGDVSVVSEPGAGSTFTIALPVSAKGQAQ